MHKRFTENMISAIELVRTKKGSKLDMISARDLLVAILELPGSLGKFIMESIKFDPRKNLNSGEKPPATDKLFSVSDLLGFAARVAHSQNSARVGTEHCVYGYLQKRSPFLKKNLLGLGNFPTGAIFSSSDSRNDEKSGEFSDFLAEATSMIDHLLLAPGPRKKNSSLLSSFCTDLCLASTPDRLLIGRTKELERVSDVLGRKMKNNPVLIGEPGVGKTAIVEGLAKKINSGTAPYYLHGKKILTLDLGLLIAGTTFRGEFEARLKDIVSEAKQNPDVILFIDEIHNLIGAGNAVGGMDAANLLKPALSRGEIQVIGATTIEEYHKNFEKDPALERRFQPIIVLEPSLKEANEILSGIKPFYEQFHNVQISVEALSTAATLAKRYVRERFLPDSAIDLVDETCARMRSLVSNTDLYRQLKLAEKQLSDTIGEKERLVLSDRYEQAIGAREQEKIITEKIADLKEKIATFEKNHPVTITPDDVRKTVSKTASIPEELLLQDKRSLPENVRILLKQKLVGQQDVIKKIYHILLRSVSGIGDARRPLGSFLLIGPTGVGKTLTAKLLGRAVSPHRNDALVQINMSEFSERHNISRLLGAPAGYVGFEEGGELLEKIRHNPFSIVLFDEIEKAEGVVLNLLLQILEEGEITDARGRKINFRNTIVILTSNIGTDELDQASKIGFEAQSAKTRTNNYGFAAESVKEKIKYLLPPELVGRLDDIIVFNPLTIREFEKILALELESLRKKLATKKIILQIRQQARKLLLAMATKTEQGARNIRKMIQSELEPSIAKLMLSAKKPRVILINSQKNKLKFHSRH